MSYDLTITRKQHPSDEVGDLISHDEWFRYVDKHAQLSISEAMSASITSEYVVWDNSECWLSWFQGSIDSKNPDCEFIERMISIAADLGAKVLGEETEHYIAHEFGYIIDGERGRLLYDRSTKQIKDGVVRYEYKVINEPAKKVRSIEDSEKLKMIEKELHKIAALKKSSERPWWKFW